MKRLILILIAFAVSGWGGVQLGGGVEAAPAGGGGFALSFSDLHDADHSDWVGYGVTCTENAGSSGDLSLGDAAGGSCNFTGSSQPTTADQWGFVEFGATADFSGPALRTKNGDMTGTEYFYATRWEATNVVIRVCDGDSNDGDCSTIGTGFAHGLGGALTGDAMIFAVVGTGDNTVLCSWLFEAIGSTDYWTDQTNWGNATYCANDDGTPESPSTVLDAYIACGAGTTCTGWGASGPDDLKAFQDGGTFKNVRVYAGSSLESDFSTHSAGGEL